MIINFSNYLANQRYHVMTQTIIPRPIAWALTQSTNESINLAPFSYFTAVSSEPALLMLSVGKKPNGDEKDTLVNIINSKKMVIHIASEQQADLVTQTAASLPYGESELATLSTNNSRLNTINFDGFSLPRLEQCDIAYGCELYEIKPLGDTDQTLIFVEIKQVYLNQNIINIDDNNRVKIYADKVKPLSRLGANEYAGITSPFTVQRPK
jgi:flavin reductase (DIM6/NTAB) family NADH-FMN oxidoreductase RutF